MRRPTTVLFIDDEPTTLAGIRRLLLGRPFDVLTAAGGAEAIEILASRPIDAVVSDLDMPETSGHDLLCVVRARWPRVLRMVLTGTAAFRSTVAVINDCAVAQFFPKPFDAEAFCRVLAGFEGRIDESRGEDERAAAEDERTRALSAIEARFPGILDVARDVEDRVVVDVAGLLAEASAAGSAAGAVLLPGGA